MSNETSNETKNNLNIHEILNATIGKILTRVAAGKLDPQLVVNRLELLASGTDDKIIRTLNRLINEIKFFLAKVEKAHALLNASAEFGEEDNDKANQPVTESSPLQFPADTDWSKISLRALDLEIRITNSLEYQRIPPILTVGDLIENSANSLLTVRTFGNRALQNVREKLASVGLKLRDD